MKVRTAETVRSRRATQNNAYDLDDFTLRKGLSMFAIQDWAGETDNEENQS